MAFGTRVNFEAVREIAFGSISGTYAAIGTATLDHTRIVSFTNGTNADVYISLDGTTNMLRVAANSFKLFDLVSNEVSDDGFFISQGTVFYVKQVSGAPTSGTVWVEVMYAVGGV